MIGAVFIITGLVFVTWQGSSCTIKYETDVTAEKAEDFEILLEQDRETVILTDSRLENGSLFLTLRSLSPGSAFITVKGPEDYSRMERVCVDLLGIITLNTYFGRASGTWIVPVLAALYTALVLGYEILQYRRGMRQSLYQYRNIRSLGWIFYILPLLLGQLLEIGANDSLIGTVRALLGFSSSLSFIVLPPAFVLSILVAVSNVKLMQREGKNWKNMLGVFLGFLILLGTVLPYGLSEFLQRTTLVDVHNEKGWALYAEMVLTHTVLAAVTYLESILLAAIFLSLKAARRIPSFDKDCILILGCQIRKDGTVTPLLKGRADRAVDFASMQEKAGGPELLFVPSGGKGEDEVVSEAAAVKKYLLERGIGEDRILTEDLSANTFENLKNSAELIRARFAEREPRIAYSTTNYHVFRAGALAFQQGIKAEGIGSPTRSYFWINAFVREFIATMYSERKKHAIALAFMTAVTFGAVLLVCLSNLL